MVQSSQVEPPSLSKVGTDDLTGVITIIPNIIFHSLHTAAPGATLSPPDNFEKLVTQSHTFTCSVSGIPAPTVTWYHNNVELSAGGVISISRPSLGTSVLRISRLAVSHTGMYQCMASNVVGRAQASRALQVRTPGEGITPTYTHAHTSIFGSLSPQQYLQCQPHPLKGKHQTGI